MFRFITNRPFWLNFIVAAILGALIILLSLLGLGWITKHGQYKTVPSLIGKDYKQSIKLLQDNGFDIVIRDSIYVDTLKQGTVIKQLPDGNSTVKVNRTVFLTLNRYVPPLIEMPKLEGLSLRFALDLLQRNHLKLLDTIFRPDFMKGTILEQQINGQKITAGQKVPWGSPVSLVVGGGLDDRIIAVPDLLGLTYNQAKLMLDTLGISIGAVIADGGVRDTGSAFIYKQNPERLDELKNTIFIHSGQLMDVWLSPVMISPMVDSVAVGTTATDVVDETTTPKKMKHPKKNTDDEDKPKVKHHAKKKSEPIN